MTKSYDKILELLGKETYPHLYIHKVIGINSDRFQDSVSEFESKFPKLKCTKRRLNASPTANYIALTYEILADNPEEIVEMLKATALILDVKVVL